MSENDDKDRYRKCAECSCWLLIPGDVTDRDAYSLAASWGQDLAGAWLCPKCR
jgi:hypothetical protein